MTSQHHFKTIRYHTVVSAEGESNQSCAKNISVSLKKEQLRRVIKKIAFPFPAEDIIITCASNNIQRSKRELDYTVVDGQLYNASASNNTISHRNITV